MILDQNAKIVFNNNNKTDIECELRSNNGNLCLILKQPITESVTIINGEKNNFYIEKLRLCSYKSDIMGNSFITCEYVLLEYFEEYNTNSNYLLNTASLDLQLVETVTLAVNGVVDEFSLNILDIEHEKEYYKNKAIYKNNDVEISFYIKLTSSFQNINNFNKLLDSVYEYNKKLIGGVKMNFIKGKFDTTILLNYVRYIRLYSLIFKRKYFHINNISIKIEDVYLNYYSAAYDDTTLFKELKNTNVFDCIFYDPPKEDEESTLSRFINKYINDEILFDDIYHLEMIQFKIKGDNAFEFLHYEFQNRFKNLVYLFEKNINQIIYLLKHEVAKNPNESCLDYANNVIDLYNCKYPQKKDLPSNFSEFDSSTVKVLRNETDNMGKLIYILIIYRLGYFDGGLGSEPYSAYEEHLCNAENVCNIAKNIILLRNVISHQNYKTEDDIEKSKLAAFKFMRNLHTQAFLYFIGIPSKHRKLHRYPDNKFSLSENTTRKQFVSTNDSLLSKYSNKKEL